MLMLSKNAKLFWSLNNHVERAHELFFIDTGCTGPLFNQHLVTKHQIPVQKKDMPIDILNAHREIIQAAGEFFTYRHDKMIGKYEETFCWELGLLKQGIIGYLPVTWMNRHNPDINWKTGTFC
jgi:hypothetical protein